MCGAKTLCLPHSYLGNLGKCPSSECGREEWLLNLLLLQLNLVDATRLNRGFNLALGKYLASLIGPRVIIDRGKNVNRTEKTGEQQPEQIYDSDSSSLVMDVVV